MPTMNDGTHCITVNAFVDGVEREVSITLDQYERQLVKFTYLHGASDMESYLESLRDDHDERVKDIEANFEAVVYRYVDSLNCFIDGNWEECAEDAIYDMFEDLGL